MKVTIDDSRFDALQLRLIEEIVVAVRDGLREAGIADGEALIEATGNLAFSIAAIIDGSQVMELEGEEILPVLTFASTQDDSELIASESGGSWMHEYVFGTLDEVFESEDDPNEDGESE